MLANSLCESVQRGGGLKLPGPKTAAAGSSSPRPSHTLEQTKAVPHPPRGPRSSATLVTAVSSQAVLQLDKAAPHTRAIQAALLSGMCLLEGHLLCWTAKQMARASGIPELLAARLGRHLQPVGLAWPLATIAQPQPPAAICWSADLCAPQNVCLIKTIMAHTRGYSFPAKVAELSRSQQT